MVNNSNDLLKKKGEIWDTRFPPDSDDELIALGKKFVPI